MHHRTCCMIFVSVMVLVFGGWIVPAIADSETRSWTAVTLTESSSALRDAAFFRGTGERGVVLAPGMALRKESWYDLARALQARGVASIALSDGSEENVHLAVKALTRFGFKHLTLVGGSMAGGAILFYATEQRSTLVDQVIALAPYGGRPVSSAFIKKFFVVADQDPHGLLAHVRDLNDRSAVPRQIKIYSGKDHAQHILTGPNGPDLQARMVAFICGD